MSGFLIRDIESRDYLPMAAIWREVFGSLDDSAVVEVCEKMEGDSRYRIFVAEAGGRAGRFSYRTCFGLSADRGP